MYNYFADCICIIDIAAAKSDKVRAADLETKQYEKTYSETNFDKAIIEIHFKYAITQNCEKFLDVVQNQIGQYGIIIKAHIG